MIGLDIGTKNIKLCQVEKKNGEYQVVAAAMVAAPPADAAERDGIIAARLKALLKAAAASSSLTAMSIGGPQLFARNFEFPALTDEELEGAVNLEASQSVFTDLSTMYTDFHVLSRQNGKADVLFAGAPRGAVDRQIDLAKNAGLNVAIVDLENNALANGLIELDRTYNNQAVILLNLGHVNSNIAVIDRGELRYIKNVAFGGKNITDEIASVYQVTPEIAEELKEKPALWAEAGLNIKNILRRASPELLESVYRSIEYCTGRKKVARIDRILLTGGTSYVHGIDVFVSEVLGIPADKWNPLTALDARECRRDLGRFISVALGLALRRVL